MAKTKISEYDATAANNTDIDSINIAEGMLPSNVNNAFRELMAHLKDMDAGTHALTSPQFTSVDINGGTADNVVIGGTTAGAGTFTTLTANTSITGTLATAAQPNVTSLGTLTSLTVSGDVSFGDNDKAIFGAGSDLQIYHDGSDSYINEAGAGNLIVQTNGANIQLDGAAGEMARFKNGSSVDLYYNNALKLATTSTGVDITGTVTADGLTVDSGATTNNVEIVSGVVATTTGTSTITLRPYNAATGTTYSRAEIIGESTGAGDTDLVIKTTTTSTGPVQRMRIDDIGDISFYEDTGTTAKFFWDASAESLGIGTSSIAYTSANRSVVHIEGSSGALLALEDTGAASYLFQSGNDLFVENDTTTGSLVFGTNASTERMRIDSSGNVGIGTSNPSTDAASGARDLVIGTSSSSIAGITINTGAGSYVGRINFGRGATNQAYGYMLCDHSYGYLGFGLAGSERMRIDSSGNLLVGTTDTTLYNNSDGSEGVRIAEDHVSIASNARTVFYVNRQTSDGEIINIRKDGTTVGSIGNNNSSGSLTINSVGDGFLSKGGTGCLQWATTSFYPATDNALSLGLSSRRFTDLYLSGSTIIDRSTSGDAIVLKTGGTERGTIHVGTGGSVTYDSQTDTRFQIGGSETMRIDSSGNLLVGKTSTSFSTAGFRASPSGFIQPVADGSSTANFNRLTSDGDIVDFRKDGTTVGSISVTSSATAYNTSSDRRLKENIDDADDAGSLIDAIQVRKFDWKVDGSHQRYGMIAQELNDVAPEAVSIPEDKEEMQSVDYSKLVPMLIKEIQSLRSRLAKLEAN